MSFPVLPACPGRSSARAAWLPDTRQLCAPGDRLRLPQSGQGKDKAALSRVRNGVASTAMPPAIRGAAARALARFAEEQNTINPGMIASTCDEQPSAQCPATLNKASEDDPCKKPGGSRAALVRTCAHTANASCSKSSFQSKRRKLRSPNSVIACQDYEALPTAATEKIRRKHTPKSRCSSR